MICAYFNYIPVVTGSNLHEQTNQNISVIATTEKD